MRIIANGNNFLSVDKSGISLLMLGREQNNVLSTYIKSLKDSKEETDKILLKNIIESSSLQNFYKTYCRLPEPGERYFKHGHLVHYIGTNNLFKAPTEVEADIEFVSVSQLDKIKQIAVPLSSFNEDEAKQKYKKLARENPVVLFSFCSFCQTVHNVTNLVKGLDLSFINEEIIQA
jgi:hypothetical protein